MKSIYYLILAGVLSFVTHACKEQGRLDHLDFNAPAPVQVQNVKVESLPGEVVLTYDIPKDQNLSYIEALYELRPGETRESKSSVYTDTLRLNGFGDTLSHRVELYSVGKNKKKSDPVIVEVKANTPPVHTVFNSMRIAETFGGVNLYFENNTQANLVVYLLVDSTGLGTWAPANTFFTNSAGGRLATRGFDAEERKFAVYIEDRWSNKSDTLFEALTPLFEEKIPKTNWKNMKLPTDTWEPAQAYHLEKVWDEKYGGYEGFASSNSSVLPQHFTLDLGAETLLSRFKVYHFGATGHLYNGSAPLKFELYGSNSPDVDGSWGNWEYLGTFDSYKPSGLPRGQLTQEDIQYASVDGEDFEFEDTPPPFRYIRMKTLSTYGSFGQVCIAELSFWGQLK